MKKPNYIFGLSLPTLGLIQVALLTVYVSAIFGSDFFFQNLMGNVGPAFFLLLFVLSALICGLLVLGYPAYLVYVEHKPKVALKLIGWSVLWLVVIIALQVVASSVG